MNTWTWVGDTPTGHSEGCRCELSLGGLPGGCQPGMRDPSGREAEGGDRPREGSLAAVCLDFGGVDVGLGLLDPGKDLFEECLVLRLALLQPLIHSLHVLA